MRSLSILAVIVSISLVKTSGVPPTVVESANAETPDSESPKVKSPDAEIIDVSSVKLVPNCFLPSVSVKTTSETETIDGVETVVNKKETKVGVPLSLGLLWSRFWNLFSATEKGTRKKEEKNPPKPSNEETVTQGGPDDGHDTSGSGIFKTTTVLGIASVLSLLCYLWFSESLPNIGVGLPDLIPHFTEFNLAGHAHDVAASATHVAVHNADSMVTLHPMSLFGPRANHSVFPSFGNSVNSTSTQFVPNAIFAVNPVNMTCGIANGVSTV